MLKVNKLIPAPLYEDPIVIRLIKYAKIKRITNSRPRMLVAFSLRELQTAQAEEIWEFLRHNEYEISISTIYNNLRILIQANIVVFRKIDKYKYYSIHSDYSKVSPGQST